NRELLGELRGAEDSPANFVWHKQAPCVSFKPWCGIRNSKPRLFHRRDRKVRRENLLFFLCALGVLGGERSSEFSVVGATATARTPMRSTAAAPRRASLRCSSCGPCSTGNRCSCRCLRRR